MTLLRGYAAMLAVAWAGAAAVTLPVHLAKSHGMAGALGGALAGLGLLAAAGVVALLMVERGR